MRILPTGGAGFIIGSALVAQLIRHGEHAEVFP